MNQIHIYDDGTMYGYRIRLFEAIAERNNKILFVLHATQFELTTNCANLKLLKSHEHKFGRFRFRGIKDYANYFKNNCVIAINWNYPLDLFIGLIARSKFWGGGFTVRASKSVFLYFFLKMFSILGAGIMLYLNSRLNLNEGNIRYFRNISQFCFVKKNEASNIIYKLPSKYALFVGRIDSKKGLEELLSISGDDINYVIVGSGPSQPKLAEIIQKNGLSVSLISSTTDVDLLFDIFERSTLIVSPGQTGLLAEDATFFRKRLFTINSDYSGPEAAVAAADGYVEIFDNVIDLYSAMRQFYKNDHYVVADSRRHEEWLKSQLLGVIVEWSKFLEINSSEI